MVFHWWLGGLGLLLTLCVSCALSNKNSICWRVNLRVLSNSIRHGLKGVTNHKHQRIFGHLWSTHTPFVGIGQDTTSLQSIRASPCNRKWTQQSQPEAKTALWAFRIYSFTNNSVAMLIGCSAIKSIDQLQLTTIDKVTRDSILR